MQIDTRACPAGQNATRHLVVRRPTCHTTAKSRTPEDLARNLDTKSYADPRLVPEDIPRSRASRRDPPTPSSPPPTPTGNAQPTTSSKLPTPTRKHIGHRPSGAQAHGGIGPEVSQSRPSRAEQANAGVNNITGENPKPANTALDTVNVKGCIYKPTG